MRCWCNHPEALSFPPRLMEWFYLNFLNIISLCSVINLKGSQNLIIFLLLYSCTVLSWHRKEGWEGISLASQNFPFDCCEGSPSESWSGMNSVLELGCDQCKSVSGCINWINCIRFYLYLRRSKQDRERESWCYFVYLLQELHFLLCLRFCPF